MDKQSLMPFSRWGGLFAGADPFAALRRDMDRMFEGFGRPGGDDGFLAPKVDVAETDAGLEVTAELPGVDQKDIDIDLADGVLTLKAERRSTREESDGKKHYHLKESSYGTYLRRFALPFVPDMDKVAARFEKGVLTVTVPRAPEAAKQARKVAIQS